jgi:hypothetical protein
MRTYRSTIRRTFFGGAGLLAFFATVGFSTPSDAADRYGGFRLPHSSVFAGHYGYRHVGGYGGGYRGRGYIPRSGPIYHGPSLHYDSVWHHEFDHWTPGSGWHSHGHFDQVPHYVPGHFDYHHFDHIDPNPWYHH